MLPNTSSDFISEMGAFNQRHYDRKYRKLNREYGSFNFLEVSYFARNIYETETVTSVLCYIEDLIFRENNIV